MTSAALGRVTSPAEVTNVSAHGFWLFVGERELFVPFKEFPWFRDASIAQLCNVEWPQADHLHWPDLDVDLSVESIDHPERFPLMSRAKRKSPPRAGRPQRALRRG